MAKVLLHSVSLDDDRIAEFMRGAYKLLRDSAMSSVGVHTLTEDPVVADLIIFTEVGGNGLFSERVRHHSFYKLYPEKCFIFDSQDKPIPFLPGVYASLSDDINEIGRTRTGYYLRVDDNPYVDFRPLSDSAPYLGSFVGSLENAPCRGSLKQLPADLFLIEDTSSYALKMLYAETSEQKHAFWSHYAESISSAFFSLCPRGRGVGSIRLFESMCMGRCPVIISDGWVRPQRVDWASCSLTITESEIGSLPQVLEQHRESAAELGLRAREEWLNFYSPAVRFHWLVEDCLSILSHRSRSERLSSALIWRSLINYRTLRMFMTSKRQLFQETRTFLF